ASGAAFDGRVRYMTAAEYDFERIPVPGVTQGRGPDIVEQSATIFVRTDVQARASDTFTFEALAFPTSTRSLGLSPLRDESAAPDLGGHDLFGGFTVRHVFTSPSVLTLRVGIFRRGTTLRSPGSGPSALSPEGWRGNWFSSIERRASRETVQLSWERSVQTAHGAHDFTAMGGVAFRRLRDQVVERSVLVDDGTGNIVRSIDFAVG